MLSRIQFLNFVPGAGGRVLNIMAFMGSGEALP